MIQCFLNQYWYHLFLFKKYDFKNFFIHLVWFESLIFYSLKSSEFKDYIMLSYIFYFLYYVYFLYLSIQFYCCNSTDLCNIFYLLNLIVQNIVLIFFFIQKTCNNIFSFNLFKLFPDVILNHLKNGILLKYKYYLNNKVIFTLL